MHSAHTSKHITAPLPRCLQQSSSARLTLGHCVQTTGCGSKSGEASLQKDLRQLHGAATTSHPTVQSAKLPTSEVEYACFMSVCYCMPMAAVVAGKILFLHVG